MKQPNWHAGVTERLQQRLTVAICIALALLTAVSIVTFGWYITTMLILLTIAVLSGMSAVMEINWRMYGWRTPEAIDDMGFHDHTEDRGRDSFSLIVCAKDEPDVLEHTLALLARQTHPNVQIIASLIEGDYPTIEAAMAAKEQFPDRIEILVRAYEKNMKPHQLNAAIPLCTGTYVGVMDAEDTVAIELLESVEATFQRSGADIVQGGVQLMNIGSRLRDWFCVHNVLEYKFWFCSRMMYQAEMGFVPLGGNTVFIRRDLLVEAGGWPISLTEDCALGVKLSTQYGAKVVAAYDPDLVTREETPDDVRGLIHQRVRWVAGFGMELLQKEWWKLPTFRLRFLAWYILATPFIQAATGILLPISILCMLFLDAPVGLVIITFLPYIPIFLTLALQTVGLREFGRLYDQKVRWRHYAFLVFGFVPYQMVLSWASIRAIAKISRGNMDWWKTPHSNKHRGAVAPQPIAEAVT